MVETTTWHVKSKLHIVVDGIVDRLDAVGVVDGEFGIVRCLDIFVDETVDYLWRQLTLKCSQGVRGLLTPSEFMFSCTP